MSKKYFASCNKYRILHAQRDFHLLYRNYTSLDGLQKNVCTIELNPKLKLKLSFLLQLIFWKTSEVAQNICKKEPAINILLCQKWTLTFVFWRIVIEIILCLYLTRRYARKVNEIRLIKKTFDSRKEGLFWYFFLY